MTFQVVYRQHGCLFATNIHASTYEAACAWLLQREPDAVPLTQQDSLSQWKYADIPF